MRLRGFALAELIVSLVIAGIIGLALTKLIINQSRFVATQDSMTRARSGARAALNVLQSEIRMVTDSGLRAASADSIVIRVPYVFGTECGHWAGTSTIVGLIPADSANMGLSVASGMAWRDSTGHWRFVEPTTITPAAPTVTCWSHSPVITVMSTAKWTQQAVYATGIAPTDGAPIYFYQNVTYLFGPSVDMPGRRALWRAVPSAGLREEMVTPFDSSARFEFIVGNALAVQSAPPAVLDSVMGVRMRLVAASDNTPGGRSGPITFNLTTTLMFRNHVY